MCKLRGLILDNAQYFMSEQYFIKVSIHTASRVSRVASFIGLGLGFMPEQYFIKVSIHTASRVASFVGLGLRFRVRVSRVRVS